MAPRVGDGVGTGKASSILDDEIYRIFGTISQMVCN